MIQNYRRKAISGVAICFAYVANSGCGRGGTWNPPPSRGYFGGMNLQRRLESGLLRRGGSRKCETMLNGATEINDSMQYLGEKYEGSRRIERK